MRRLALAVFVTLSAPGCATTFGSWGTRVYFESQPKGATVFVDGDSVCVTPCTKPHLQRHDGEHVEYRMAGFGPVRETLHQSAGLGWILADVLVPVFAVALPEILLKHSDAKYRDAIGNPSDLKMVSMNLFGFGGIAIMVDALTDNWSHVGLVQHSAVLRPSDATPADSLRTPEPK